MGQCYYRLTYTYPEETRIQACRLINLTQEQMNYDHNSGRPISYGAEGL